MATISIYTPEDLISLLNGEKGTGSTDALLDVQIQSDLDFINIENFEGMANGVTLYMNLDGNNHTIKNIRCNKYSGDFYFFRIAGASCIRNVMFDSNRIHAHSGALYIVHNTNTSGNLEVIILNFIWKNSNRIESNTYLRFFYAPSSYTSTIVDKCGISGDIHIGSTDTNQFMYIRYGGIKNSYINATIMCEGGLRLIYTIGYVINTFVRGSIKTSDSKKSLSIFDSPGSSSNTCVWNYCYASCVTENWSSVGVYPITAAKSKFLNAYVDEIVMPDARDVTYRDSNGDVLCNGDGVERCQPRSYLKSINWLRDRGWDI